MLNLLHRHVLREVLVSTGLALGLFVFVLLLGNALRDIAELVAAGKLSAIVFLKLMGLLIPYVTAYALPLGVLTGTLMAIGRLSSAGDFCDVGIRLELISNCCASVLDFVHRYGVCRDRQFALCTTVASRIQAVDGQCCE